MKKLRQLIILLLSVLFIPHGFSQIPNGAWRDHFSYYRGADLAISGDKVFCSFQQGGMLSFRKTDGEIEKHSKVTGLSDIDITALGYSQEEDILVAGYNSGNIDLLISSGLINIPDIKRKSLATSKRINKIKTYKQFAYLACDFGIVVIDLQKNEIKDSYFFGPGGTAIKVNDLAILDNFLYAATELGLYKVDLNSPNLLDHFFWTLQTDIPEVNTEYIHVETFSNYIFAVYKQASNKHDEIIYLDNAGWKSFYFSSDTVINNINTINNQLCIASESTSKIYNHNLMEISSIALENTKKLLVDTDGTVYTANNNGFFKLQGNSESKIAVKAPLFNPQGQVAVHDNQVWISSGGPNKPYNAGGAYNFTDENWKSLVDGWGRGMNGVGNFYKMVYHPDNPNRVFASAYLYGLWEIDDFHVVNEHRWENTPLFRSTVEQNVDIRIMGLDFDRKGDLWTIFDITNHPVYVLRNGTEWENLSLSSSLFNQTTNYTDLLVTENDQVWILSKTHGIVVLKEEPDGTIREKSFTLKNQDNETISKAYCLAEDKDGYVWVGTNKGPIYYPQMNDIFDRESIIGNSVKIPRNDGSGLADYLLDYETINDIAIDGANRKWIATSSSGSFLVSEDGLKTIHQFTFDNSPLISNNIISIGVKENSGEVFMSTNKGLVSFMGTATEGNEAFENVYVYPNPVRPGYTGDITITGIISNASVKITDVSGNLVYETSSLGGQAVWDGKNFDGRRVSSGVYLVFMTNDDGSKTHITKLVFIN